MSSEPRWDTLEGWKRWISGNHYGMDIAIELGVSYVALRSYAKAHNWGPCKAGEKPKKAGNYVGRKKVFNERLAFSLWHDKPELTQAEIATEVGLSMTSLADHAKANGWRWPRTNIANKTRATWDVVAGKRLFDLGVSFDDIALAVGKKRDTVKNFAIDNWPPRAGIDHYKMTMRGAKKTGFRNTVSKGPRPKSENGEETVDKRTAAYGRGATLPPLPSTLEPVYVVKGMERFVESMMRIDYTLPRRGWSDTGTVQDRGASPPLAAE